LTPLYPDVHISLHTRNRFAVVSAIRHGLRRAGTPAAEIERFCLEALGAQDPRSFEEICRDWVRIDRVF